MRGFRGTRAAQNLMAFRYGGHHDDGQYRPGHYNNQNPSNTSGGSQQPRQLPDWVKTPETRAREQQNGTTYKRPDLRLIQGGQSASAPITRAQKPATKKKASSAHGPARKMKTVAKKKAGAKTKSTRTAAKTRKSTVHRKKAA